MFTPNQVPTQYEDRSLYIFTSIESACQCSIITNLRKGKHLFCSSMPERKIPDPISQHPNCRGHDKIYSYKNYLEMDSKQNHV